MGHTVSTRKTCRPGSCVPLARDPFIPVDQVDLKMKGASRPLQRTLVHTLTSATVATVDPNSTPKSTFSKVEVEDPPEDRAKGPHPQNVQRVTFHNRVEIFSYTSSTLYPVLQQLALLKK